MACVNKEEVSVVLEFSVCFFTVNSTLFCLLRGIVIASSSGLPRLFVVASDCKSG